MNTTRNPKRIFWLADKVFYSHCLLTIAGAVWSALVNQPGLGVLILITWALAFTIWQEWRHA